MKRLLPIIVLVLLANTLFSQLVKEGELFKFESSLISNKEYKRYLLTNNYILSNGDILSWRNHLKNQELRIIDPVSGIKLSQFFPLEPKNSFGVYGNLSIITFDEKMLVFDANASIGEISFFEMYFDTKNQLNVKHVNLFSTKKKLDDIDKVSNKISFNGFSIFESPTSNYLGFMYLPLVEGGVSKKEWTAEMVFFDQHFKKVQELKVAIKGRIVHSVSSDNLLYILSGNSKDREDKDKVYLTRVDIKTGEIVSNKIDLGVDIRSLSFTKLNDKYLMLGGVYGSTTKLPEGHFNCYLDVADLHIISKSYYPYDPEFVVKDATARWMNELNAAETRGATVPSFIYLLNEILPSENGGYYLMVEDYFIRTLTNSSSDGFTHSFSSGYTINNTVISYVDADGVEVYTVKIPKRLTFLGWDRRWANPKMVEHNGDLYVIYVDNYSNYNIPINDYKYMNSKNAGVFVSKVDKAGKVQTEYIMGVKDGAMIDISTLRKVNNALIGESSRLSPFDFGNVKRLNYKITIKK